MENLKMHDNMTLLNRYEFSDKALFESLSRKRQDFHIAESALQEPGASFNDCMLDARLSASYEYEQAIRAVWKRRPDILADFRQDAHPIDKKRADWQFVALGVTVPGSKGQYRVVISPVDAKVLHCGCKGFYFRKNCKHIADPLVRAAQAYLSE